MRYSVATVDSAPECVTPRFSRPAVATSSDHPLSTGDKMRNHDIWTALFVAAIAANNSVKQAESKADDAFAVWQKNYEAKIEAVNNELAATEKSLADTVVILENTRKREKAWADAHKE